jgi:hypothetical protein
MEHKKETKIDKIKKSSNVTIVENTSVFCPGD